MASNYANEKKLKNKEQALTAAKEMPEFVTQYLIAKANSTATSSLLSYTYDIVAFLTWWHDQLPEYKDKPIRSLTAADMANIEPQDINEYLFTMTSTQAKKTLARKCTAIASLFEYMVNYGIIEKNPMEKVERPRYKKDSRIIKLEKDEIELLLNAIEHGCKEMSKQQQKYLENTKVRDLAIVTLLLTTGIRVSECVGLDIDDIFLKTHQMQVTRKGDKKQTLALSDEAIDALTKYLKDREDVEVKDLKDRRALFLSSQKKRMCEGSVENMVTKYTTALGFGKRITPHKLRKTYGTNLYNETRDIYLVASALGHESVNTTTQHYVASREEDLQEVRNLVKLKDDNNE